MGLIKAGLGALGGVLADQWKEFFYCDALPQDVLMRKGEKRISGRSSNKKGSDNVISNGSGIAVADGQCMIIVEQGKVVEVCAEPGEYTYDTSTEPSIFSGKFGSSLLETFKLIGKRFTYGGDTAKDQRVYYFNTKEITNNKFGTPSPILFRVVNKELNMAKTVNVRCNGIYSYVVSNPLLLYTTLAGNAEYEFTRAEIDAQLKASFVDALQPAFGVLSAEGLYPHEIPARAADLKKAMNDALAAEWTEKNGISIEKISLNPITLSEEDMKTIASMEDAYTYGNNAAMMLARKNEAYAKAMEAAANNSAGAMTGFMGMGMAMNQGGNNDEMLMQMALQQQQAKANKATQAENTWKCACGATPSGKFCPECGAKKPEPVKANTWKCACGTEATGKFCPECGAKKPADAQGWTCSCGAVNKGKFCNECGAKKPADAPLYRCDKCGWEPEDPHNPPRFCAECGDPFNENDIQS